ISIGTCLAAPLLRAAVQKFKFLPGIANYVLLPAALDDLALGVLVMLLLRHHKVALLKHSRAIAWTAAAFVIALSIYPYIPNPQAIRLEFVIRTAYGMGFALGILALLLFPQCAIARFLSTRTMRNLGNMAYSTYLLHPIALCVVFMVLWKSD